MLFGFRGCMPVHPHVSEAYEWELKFAKTDYMHMRCTLGIWNTETKRIFAAPGSTVPNIRYVTRATLKGGRGANQLEPGFYRDLIKGEHLEGKLDGHQALRQSGYRFIRRTLSGIPYSRDDTLFFSNPYDNLHCAWNIKPEVSGFSSAGCLVVAGMPFCKRHPNPRPNTGHWRKFHEIIYSSRIKKFALLLLPAKEAVIALGGVRGPFLCYGSQGSMVFALQKKLKALGYYKGKVNGILNSSVYRAWDASKFIKF